MRSHADNESNEPPPGNNGFFFKNKNTTIYIFSAFIYCAVFFFDSFLVSLYSMNTTRCTRGYPSFSPKTMGRSIHNLTSQPPRGLYSAQNKLILGGTQKRFVTEHSSMLRSPLVSPFFLFSNYRLTCFPSLGRLYRGNHQKLAETLEI